MRTPLALALALLPALGGCTTGARSGRRPRFDEEPAAPAVAATPGPSTSGRDFAREAEGGGGSGVESPVVVDDRFVGRLTAEDFAEFNRAWALFVRKDRAWPEARDRWLQKGGAAPYVLAENLLRYFVSASAYGDRKDLAWVAVSAKKVGEPAVGYFGSLLLTDERRLERPVAARGKDGSVRQLDRWVNDDVTRQHLAAVLAYVGEAAVATLGSDAYLRAPSPNARRYVIYALGRIGTDRAVDALGPVLGFPAWQDRGAAAKALGVALAYGKNERARPWLERAKADPDEFVRKKVEEALAGRSKPEV